MEWNEIEDWINSNICKDFIDEDVNNAYRIIGKFDESLLHEIMDETKYKMALKNINRLMPSSMDRDMILDNLKDLLLIGGCQDYSLDGYMDWEGFVQAEIDERYEEFDGEYILYDELVEFLSDMRKICEV